jgi:hypothetical protein
MLLIGGVIRTFLYRRRYRNSFATFGPVVLGPSLVLTLIFPRPLAMIIAYLLGFLVLACAVDNWYIKNPLRKGCRKVYDYFKMPEYK